MVLLFIQKKFGNAIKYVSTECKAHAENRQLSFCFCKTCICLKILENIQISVNMIDRLVKCDFILNTIVFICAALNISLRKCNVL